MQKLIRTYAIVFIMTFTTVFAFLMRALQKRSFCIPPFLHARTYQNEVLVCKHVRTLVICESCEKNTHKKEYINKYGKKKYG